LNSELCKKALELVGNPNILVNIVSRRVRQLMGGGPGAKSLVVDTARLGAADMAMLELVEGKLGWEMLEEDPALVEASLKKPRTLSSRIRG
jgi:DNA-directed RNA polymerase subunit omega